MRGFQRAYWKQQTRPRLRTSTSTIYWLPRVHTGIVATFTLRIIRLLYIKRYLQPCYVHMPYKQREIGNRLHTMYNTILQTTNRNIANLLAIWPQPHIHIPTYYLNTQPPTYTTAHSPPHHAPPTLCPASHLHTSSLSISALHSTWRTYRIIIVKYNIASVDQRWMCCWIQK